ncbi:MAG: hypothetical protein P1V35_12095 [Planctomycetota bacterium]|nr:hypothetical protein [Planctomycetota bacterium]
MQTNIAPSQSLAQPRGLSRRVRLWTLLGLQALVFIAVTRPLFRSILVSAGESDAKGAVRLIARELAALPNMPPDNLGAWVSDQPLIQHRLADVRIVEDHLEYHGYRITWKPTALGSDGLRESRGTLWAVPLDPGKTGRTHFHIQVD